MAVKIKIGTKLRKNWKKIVIYGLFCFAAALGVMIGYFLSSMAELPEVSQLQYYRPNIITSIYSEDGTTIQEYAIEKRMVVNYNNIPKYFIDAIIAVEDERFFEHSGIDIKGIFRAFWANLVSGEIVQGASTLTMQLSRNIFLSTEQTWTRKLKEALYAIKIEKHYTKAQILELFANQVYFGHNRYGLSAAAEFFFSKKPRQLNLEESAILAGVLKGPNYYTPLRHPVRALRRRNLVLDRMVETGAITRAEAIEAKNKSIELNEAKKQESLAPYFTEEIRKFMSKKYGSQKIYRDGLKVYTTLNLKLQQAAQRALRGGLRNLDKRQGWRGPIRNVFEPPDEAEDSAAQKNDFVPPVSVEDYIDPSWENVEFEKDALINGVIISSTKNEALVKIKDKTFKIGKNEIKWTKKRYLTEIFKKGDLALFLVTSIEKNGTIKITLDQEPIVEGALVAIETNTGRILAMVGGYSFKRSPFNRVTQSTLQAGSAFKPILYVSALEDNMALTDRVVDEPTIFMEPGMEEPYQPKNENKKYRGIVTLRTALEKSINVPAVKLIDKISAKRVVEMGRRMGISEGLEPVLSLALGACIINPLKLTSIYTIFSNGGLLIEPYLIEEITDREENTIYRNIPRTREVISQEDAYLITYALQGAVQNGTGRRAKQLGVPLAGKTGTTDDYTDAWFMGYSPSITCGVWVGFSEGKKTLGKGEVGARAALPIWVNFMKVAIIEKPGGDFRPPIGIVFKLIEKRTGFLATQDIPPEFLFQEAFKYGTEPTRYVTPEDLVNIDQPYHLQDRDISIF